MACKLNNRNFIIPIDKKIAFSYAAEIQFCTAAELNNNYNKNIFSMKFCFFREK